MAPHLAPLAILWRKATSQAGKRQVTAVNRVVILWQIRTDNSLFRICPSLIDGYFRNLHWMTLPRSLGILTSAPNPVKTTKSGY